MKMNRRKFVVSAATVAGAPALHTGKGGPLGANDRVICGFVGTGGMGRSNMRDFLRSGQVRAAAVCDVWDHNRDLTLQMTADQEGGPADGYKDFRQVLDLKEVDVVVVSTPDHWHALPTVMACDAGKDVYVEKPLSLTIYEGRKMVEAARRNGRIVQMGTQQRSGAHFQEAVKLVREGAIGKVSRVNTWNYGNESPAGMGRPRDTEPPPGLDWDLWLGPAPEAPFNGNRFIHTFRWFWDYSGGMLTDWGTHHLDIVQWAMQVDTPLAATAVGGNFCIDDNRETPDTLEVLYEYPGFIASFSHRVGNAHGPDGRGYGIEFFGTDGTMYLNRGGFEIRPETGGTPVAPRPGYQRILDQKTPDRRRREWSSGEGRSKFVTAPGSDQHFVHVLNFLDCVRSRKKPNSEVEIGHRSTSTPHLGNIALRLGRRIRWDGVKERVLGDDEANGLLQREYRKPWVL